LNTRNHKARDWLSTTIKVVLFIFALIGYGRVGRDWLRDFLGGEWQLGFFEGAVVTVIIFVLVKKYGSAIDDVILGLRELGRQRRVQIVQEEHQEDNSN